MGCGVCSSCSRLGGRLMVRRPGGRFRINVRKRAARARFRVHPRKQRSGVMGGGGGLRDMR
jgi:hypothetical protein